MKILVSAKRKNKSGQPLKGFDNGTGSVLMNIESDNGVIDLATLEKNIAEIKSFVNGEANKEGVKLSDVDVTINFNPFA